MQDREWRTVGSLGGIMSRLWKVSSTLAEYTLGTVIVLYQLAMSRAFEERERPGRGEAA